MKKLIALVVILFALNSARSQTTIKQDANGNYVAVKSIDSANTGAKPTGKTYTDTKGNVYPVMISKNGKLFIARVSKTGNKYNQYLKL